MFSVSEYACVCVCANGFRTVDVVNKFSNILRDMHTMCVCVIVFVFAYVALIN